MHVLHLEDDPLQLTLVERGLRNASFSVDSCSSILEATKLLDQFQYCVAVVDLRLHEENGMEFVGQLVKRKARTKAIVHTANASFESAQVGIELGIFAYVEKSRGLAHLVEQVGRAASTYLLESHAYAQRAAIIGQMADSLAYEINQPLSAITNYAGGLRLGLKDSNSTVDEQIEILDRIQSQAIRAGEIVSRLQGYGFGTSGAVFELLDIHDVIVESLKLVEFELREHRTVVDLRKADSPQVVRGDRIQLIQVLVNILRNSMEAMATVDPKDRKCTLTTKPLGAHLQVEIQDQGPGIPSEMLSELMEPYYSTKKGGIGLGLSICKSIMENHRGTISLECREPRGLTVCLTMPCSKR